MFRHGRIWLSRTHALTVAQHGLSKASLPFGLFCRNCVALERIEIRRIGPLRLFIWAVIALGVTALIAGLAALSFGAAWLRRVLRR